jgi:hypothetical protein
MRPNKVYRITFDHAVAIITLLPSQMKISPKRTAEYPVRPISNLGITK